MKKILTITLFFIFSSQYNGQKNDANSIFVEAEELFNSKNFDKALSKLELYENLSNSSKEKSQILKIQIFREKALKNSVYAEKYNTAIDDLKKMYAEGKNVNLQDLHRILKDQQEFNEDIKSQNKENLSSISSEINIDGIKIGMDAEEIPKSSSININWENPIKNPAVPPVNYATVTYMTTKFNSEGIQSIVLDDRTRKVISVSKITKKGRYKENEKTGFDTFNKLVNDLKNTFGEKNITVNPPQIMKTMNINSETHSVSINNSKSVLYVLIYNIVKNTYTITESLNIKDIYKL